MSNQGLVSIMIFLIVMIFTGCISLSFDEGEMEDLGKEIVELLIKQEYEVVYDEYGANEWIESTSLSSVISNWEKQIDLEGRYVQLTSIDASERGEHSVVEIEIQYTNMSVDVRMIFNKEQELVGLHRASGEVSAVVPKSIIEEELIVGEGTKFELEGVLTMPSEIDQALPAVVLVHGSGPSDRDSAVHSYKPFRDIAWGLAERGIAVLRYDKRTYSYGDQLTPEEMTHFTVHEETVEDAVRASNLLKSDERIDSTNVYVAGHSQGGMLAPRVDDSGGYFAGIMILAGSPRPMWEIVYDQNIAFLDSDVIDESERESLITEVEQHYELAQRLDDLSLKEIESTQVFGLPAYYLLDMDKYNPVELLEGSSKPVLILHGETDFQVTYEADFLAWQEALESREKVTFKSYPQLNHFFIESRGDNQGTIGEYEQPGIVADEVIEDMAQWVWIQSD
ncbi:alpha/beta fold hydrolase [Halalkalibacter sp. APA_J-10(15)]|uniref:alpha/beta hydrolase n=1 Tax=unclassified Halalkalibacter TaxID=2893063 RepID=UPI001FF40DB9|nr:alpha/beta fold hydrolase [Halalkalibacter sp. APA_J-10(15)]MCK0471014.1 alpha/beta fold hydrolase [Halalkalibacter sp. APA_J-10(15)]